MEENKKSRKPKILMFLCDTLVAKIFEDTFSKAGFEVEVFYSYSELLDLMAEENPDILLCDVFVGRTAREIEKRNGFQAIKLLKANDKTKDIPIVILTTLCYEESIEEGLRTGAEEYLCLTNLSPSEILEAFIKQLIKTGKFTQEDFKNL